MKTNTIIYWVTTALLGVLMLFSAYSYFTNPDIMAAFKHLGFPDYFRKELAVAKIAGAVILLLPQLPVKIKDWAYAGFGITFLSAVYAHYTSGDPVSVVLMPLMFFAVLVLSAIFLHRKNKALLLNVKNTSAVQANY